MSKKPVIRRTDGNHSTIVNQCRRLGFSVFSTHTVGDGFVDIVVGHKGRNYLFEVKDPAQPPSKRKLTPDEVKFHESWRGQIDVVECVEDILRIVNSEL